MFTKLSHGVMFASECPLPCPRVPAHVLSRPGHVPRVRDDHYTDPAQSQGRDQPRTERGTQSIFTTKPG